MQKLICIPFRDESGEARNVRRSASHIFFLFALCTSTASQAGEERFRIALKHELEANGKTRLGVQNRSEVPLRCRYARPDGRLNEIDPLPPGAIFWIGVDEGPRGKWNCQRSTKTPPQ